MARIENIGNPAWRLQDLTGQKFGRLNVVSRAPNRGPHVMWNCVCDCGTHRIVRGSGLKTGNTLSCGCLNRELHRDICLTRNTTHGKSGRLDKRAPVYIVWNNMIQRCTNPKNTAWDNYGRRGINVCERWRTFENFYADVGDVPPGKSIDRIDNDGDYEPGNVRWADRKTQVTNQRQRRRGYAAKPKRTLTFNDETLGIAEWARKIGIDRKTLGERLRGGWAVEAALTTPLDARYSFKRKK